MNVSLQFDGDGNLALDGDGNPIYAVYPTGDIVQAIRTTLDTFHADPDMGGRVPLLTTGAPAQPPEIESATLAALARLETVGTLQIEAVESAGNSVTVHEITTNQQIKVNL